MLFSSYLIEKMGLYDKVIMDCSFKAQKSDKLSKGCDYFKYVITSNGICQSFNGLGASDVWATSKLIKSFEETFATDHNSEHFGGTGPNQGIFARFYLIYYLCDIFHFESRLYLSGTISVIVHIFICILAY